VPGGRSVSRKVRANRPHGRWGGGPWRFRDPAARGVGGAGRTGGRRTINTLLPRCPHQGQGAGNFHSFRLMVEGRRAGKKKATPSPRAAVSPPWALWPQTPRPEGDGEMREPGWGRPGATLPGTFGSGGKGEKPWGTGRLSKSVRAMNSGAKNFWFVGPAAAEPKTKKKRVFRGLKGRKTALRRHRGTVGGGNIPRRPQENLNCQARGGGQSCALPGGPPLPRRPQRPSMGIGAV